MLVVSREHIVFKKKKSKQYWVSAIPKDVRGLWQGQTRQLHCQERLPRGSDIEVLDPEV